jgi:hypothetical protein
LKPEILPTLSAAALPLCTALRAGGDEQTHCVFIDGLKMIFVYLIIYNFYLSDINRIAFFFIGIIPFDIIFFTP